MKDISKYSDCYTNIYSSVKLLNALKLLEVLKELGEGITASSTSKLVLLIYRECGTGDNLRTHSISLNNITSALPKPILSFPSPLKPTTIVQN